MAIAALPPATLASSYLPATTQADVAGERFRPTPREAVGGAGRTEATQANATSAAPEKNLSEALRKEMRENREARPAVTTPSAHIQFKNDEGTRVMEVYDSKNILIYQVPPKGVLMLIRGQESDPISQVETTA